MHVMDNWTPSTLSWSSTRKSRFNACRRRYFYDRFWGQDPKLRWKLFEMRNITTLSKLRGQAVHAVISAALRSVRLGLEVDLEMAKQSTTEIMRVNYMESQKQLWHIDNRPRDRKASEIANLLEHYYQFPDVGEKAREARAVAWQCLANAMASDLWREIIGSDPKQWMEIDEDDFPSFDLDGIKIYTKIDFAHCNGTPTIIDWKTGASGEQDRSQLILYSLYAKSKWEWEPTETSLAAVYLYPDFRVDEFRPTADEVEAVKEETKSSFGEMMELEPAFGPANIESFPPTENKQYCPWCRFRGMCGV